MSKEKNNKAKIQAFIKRDDVSVSTNIGENCILTTEDKIKIVYNEYNGIKKYYGEFWTFLSIFITLFTTVLTCEFKSILGLPASVIWAMFILATISALGLTLYALIQWIINHKKLSFEYFISQLKGNDSIEKHWYILMVNIIIRT